MQWAWPITKILRRFCSNFGKETILNKLYTCILNWRHHKVEQANSVWLKERHADVLFSLMSEASPAKDKPFAENGLWHWCVESPIGLDFFFPESQLAVKITGRHFGHYDEVEQYTKSRGFWEAEVAADSYIVDVCDRAGVRTLLIAPNDPIDQFSLAVQIRKLLRQ